MSWRASILGVLSNCITVLSSLTVPESDERRLRNALADLRALEDEFETVGLRVEADDRLTIGYSDEADINDDVVENLLSMTTAMSSRRLFGDHYFVRPRDELKNHQSALYIPVTASDSTRAIALAADFARDIQSGELPSVAMRQRCECCSAQATAVMEHLGYGPIHVVGHSTAECQRNPLLSKRTGEALLAITSLQDVLDLRPIYLDAPLLEEEE